MAGPLLDAEEASTFSMKEDEVEVELLGTEGMEEDDDDDEGSGKPGDKERGEVVREGEEGEEDVLEEPWRIGDDDAKTFW